MLVLAGGVDDIRAACLGDLHGEIADPAGRRVDKHALPGADGGHAHERLPGGERRHWQCRRIDVVDARCLAASASAATYSA
jgi:hypothetical protein